MRHHRYDWQRRQGTGRLRAPMFIRIVRPYGSTAFYLCVDSRGRQMVMSRYSIAILYRKRK